MGRYDDDEDDLFTPIMLSGLPPAAWYDERIEGGFMRHVTLTCKHHPNLRWSCKEIAYSPGYGYNGQRSIFFNGTQDDVHIAECACPPTDLILAPEDAYSQLTLNGQRMAIQNC